jgi:hypothetical protein
MARQHWIATVLKDVSQLVRDQARPWGSGTLSKKDVFALCERVRPPCASVPRRALARVDADGIAELGAPRCR